MVVEAHKQQLQSINVWDWIIGGPSTLNITIKKGHTTEFPKVQSHTFILFGCFMWALTTNFQPFFT
jgi:hypothetical protein